MNFLAHLHLAENSPDSMLGNLLGDFVKGYPWDNRFSSTVWKGIVEHRLVDAYTDRHRCWKMSRDLLPTSQRRYAGIAVDIYYDHFLCRHWQGFSNGESIEQFIENAHGKLVVALPQAPFEVAGVIRQMIKERWLGSYGTLDGVAATLRRVSHRSPAIASIAELPESLEKQLPEMEEHFLEFYPDLITYVSTLRSGKDSDGSTSIESRSKSGPLP